MATCKECLHHEPCWEYGNILDPIHGGMICDSFKPAADVVEVVRCKDCKYAKPMSFKGYFMCKRHHKYCRKSDDFCSYGERKEE